MVYGLLVTMNFGEHDSPGPILKKFYFTKFADFLLKFFEHPGHTFDKFSTLL